MLRLSPDSGAGERTSMKRTVVTAFVTLAASLALLPTAALADGFRGGAGGGHAAGSRPVISRPFVANPFIHHRSVHRPFVHRPLFRPVIPFAVIAAPVVVYAPPPVYYSAPPAYYNSPSSYDPPVVYGPPARGTVAVAPAPAPPPMPSVVQYPHGRYELRGDGTTVPYTWVWIPNPPPPPPPAGAPPAPPAMEEPAPERHSQLYLCTDAQGVAQWTDRWDAIPPQYSAQSTQPPTSWATRMPPIAGASTVVAPAARKGSARAAPSAAACSGCWRTSADWR